MAAPVVLHGKVSSCLAADRGNSAGRVWNSDWKVVVDTVCEENRKTVQSGGRGGTGKYVNLKVGLGASRRLRFGWTEEQLGSRDEAHARGNGNSGRRRALVATQAMWEARAEPKKTWIPLELIASDTQFDQILNEARERNEAIVIDWMAAWCRKCLYLKPKLEKLAANYHPNIRFYYVDINVVPQSLVRRAEVTQMPTIQIWRDGVSEAEVIGGQEAMKVVEQVREMISNSSLKG